jgi:hypothetical protein
VNIFVEHGPDGHEADRLSVTEMGGWRLPADAVVHTLLG